MQTAIVTPQMDVKQTLELTLITAVLAGLCAQHRISPLLVVLGLAMEFAIPGMLIVMATSRQMAAKHIQTPILATAAHAGLSVPQTILLIHLAQVGSAMEPATQAMQIAMGTDK